MKNIEQTELEKLRNLNKSFSDLRSSLADLEIQRRTIQIHKENVFRDMDNLSGEFKELEAELLAKYGNVKINLQTGEITDDKD